MTVRRVPRRLTDREIGLIKAMLHRGLANDEIHFYFNRADRLLSPGRITQIKNGAYGALAPEASPSEVESFITAWLKQQAAGSTRQPHSPTDSEVIRSMFTSVNGTCSMRLGETDNVECKLNFRVTPEHRFADVIKAIAGLANNKGGYIFFGVRDKTFSVEGLGDDNFINADPASINRVLVGALDPVPKVSKLLVSIDSRQCGVLYVEKHIHPPVIALKGIANDVKEGGIYYRYVGETRLIKPGELRQLIAEREQRAVAEFSRRINRVAVGTSATLDLDTGEVRGSAGRFLIDKRLLKDIEFLREGDFSEVPGAPALRLVGEVEPISEVERERVRVIRENVTPDATVRNFLHDTKVAHPLQYIHAQAHTQRKWQPIWFYVEQSRVDVVQLMLELKGIVATVPTSRDQVVSRLSGSLTARKIHVGKAVELLKKIAQGVPVSSATVAQDQIVAWAFQGLSEGTVIAPSWKPLLLAALDRAQGHDSKSSSRRSAIYRAAARLDELLRAPT